MVACGADVSKDAGAQSLVDAALDSFGKLDAVINNAEIVRTDDFLDVPVEGHQRIWIRTTRHAEAVPRRVATSSRVRVGKDWQHCLCGDVCNPMMAITGVRRLLYSGSREPAVKGASAEMKVNVIVPGAGTRMAEAATDSLSLEVLAHVR